MNGGYTIYVLYMIIIEEMLEMLRIQLTDNQKAAWVDEHLCNVLKKQTDVKPIRAQKDFYQYLHKKNLP